VPKIVDHEERRRDIARAALRVVAREGVRGADLRSVADEAGWSTGVINHYFVNKQTLLVAALREAARGVGDHMTSVQVRESGTDRVRDLLEAGMPLDDERAATCRIFFHFTAEGIIDSELAAELAGYYAWWRAQVRIAIEHAQLEGQFGSFDAGDLSESLVALAEGLGIQGMFDNATMNPRRLRRHLAVMIGRLSLPHEIREVSSHA